MILCCGEIQLIARCFSMTFKKAHFELTQIISHKPLRMFGLSSLITIHCLIYDVVHKIYNVPGYSYQYVVRINQFHIFLQHIAYWTQDMYSWYELSFHHLPTLFLDYIVQKQRVGAMGGGMAVHNNNSYSLPKPGDIINIFTHILHGYFQYWSNHILWLSAMDMCQCVLRSGTCQSNSRKYITRRHKDMPPWMEQKYTKMYVKKI